MYSIQYLPLAKNDIAGIIAYIAATLKAPGAALDLLDSFDAAISGLREFPYAHRVYLPLRQLDGEYRMLPVKNYAVFYVVLEPQRTVEIRRILYAGMDVGKTF